MSRVEGIKALVDQLTLDERAEISPHWRGTGDRRDSDVARGAETPGTARRAIRRDQVAKIEAMIDALSPMEQCELNALVQDWPDDEWDKQMKADAAAGKLDWMIEEAARSERESTARELPKPRE